MEPVGCRRRLPRVREGCSPCPPGPLLFPPLPAPPCTVLRRKHQRAAPFGTARLHHLRTPRPHRRKKPLTLSHQGLICHGGRAATKIVNFIQLFHYINFLQKSKYQQKYQQILMVPPEHRGDFRQGERAFFEVAPCCHHRSHPPYPGSQEDRNPFPAPASGLGRYRPDVAARGSNFFATLPARQGQCATFTQKSPLSARGKIFYKLLKL